MFLKVILYFDLIDFREKNNIKNKLKEIVLQNYIFKMHKQFVYVEINIMF